MWCLFSLCRILDSLYNYSNLTPMFSAAIHGLMVKYTACSWGLRHHTTLSVHSTNISLVYKKSIRKMLSIKVSTVWCHRGRVQWCSDGRVPGLEGVGRGGAGRGAGVVMSGRVLIDCVSILCHTRVWPIWRESQSWSFCLQRRAWNIRKHLLRQITSAVETTPVPSSVIKYQGNICTYSIHISMNVAD